MEKPTRPKHYILIYTLISVSSLACGMTIIFLGQRLGIKWFGSLGMMLPVFMSILIPNIIFRRYIELSKSYFQYTIEQKTSEKETERIRLAGVSSVNKNIEKYLAARRKEQEEAKWWQIWV